MNKTELINHLAKQCNIPTKNSKIFLENLLSIITKALKRGEVVTIQKFGKFWSQYHKPCVKKAPKTKNLVFLPPSFVPKFKPSPTLKQDFRSILP